MSAPNVSSKDRLIENPNFDTGCSPCTRQCELDNQRMCRGCFRTIDEILGWSIATYPMRCKIVEAALCRREYLTS